MRICSVENCPEKHYGKNFCYKHYNQIKYHGHIKERTTHDPNEFILDDDICWVILYNRYCLEIARAKFYTKYYEYISDPRLKWHLTGRGYVEAIWYYNDIQYHTLLHEAIIQLSGQVVQPGEEIDHKDGDKLNCLDDNLRICKHCENSKNRKKQINNTSGYTGVTWHKISQKWMAQIMIDGIHEVLGLFDTKEDAARAYNVAATKYFGEFAVLNDI